MAHWEIGTFNDEPVIKLSTSNRSDEALLNEKLKCGKVNYDECFGFYIPLCSNVNEFITTKGIQTNFFCAIIRNVNGVWEVLDTSGHTPVNIDRVEQDRFGGVSVYHTLEYTKTMHVSAVSDETYAAEGVLAGVSGRVGRALVYLGKDLHIGKEVTVENGVLIFNAPENRFATEYLYSATYENGEIELTHRELDNLGFDLVFADRKYSYNVLNLTKSSVRIEVFENDVKLTSLPEDLKFYFNRNGRIKVQHNEEQYPSANVWVCGFLGE